MGPRSHPGGLLLETQVFVLGLDEPYPTSSHDLKSVVWFKSYSIFTTKLVIKPGPRKKIPSFNVTRFKIELIVEMRKNDIYKLYKTAYTALENPWGHT